MADGAQPQGQLPVYVDGFYAPVMDEVTATDLSVIGEIPRDLNGIFTHNGANPRFRSAAPGYSWFDGDGMLQGVHLDDGKATFRSRWIKTAGLAEDIAADGPTYIGSNAKPGTPGKRHKNVANTDLVYHSGRLLALWWEGGTPYELSLPELETKGLFDYQGTLKGGLTSHAKVDPKTGELIFFSWGARRPFLQVGIADRTGRVTHEIPIDLPGPRVQHDIGMSDRFVCVFDFPMRLDLSRPDQDSLGFVLDDDVPARIGLLDRQNLDAPVRWFEAKPCFMWHLSSAWDEGDEFVLVGVRVEGATRVDKHGGVHEDLPLVDGEHRFDTSPYMWRLNTRTGGVVERRLDDAYVEFPRMNDNLMGSPARYTYMAAIAAGAKTMKTNGLIKYDLATGRKEIHNLPDGQFCYEASFVARDGGRDEDDGYLLNFVTSEADMTSEFWITAARDLHAGPVARVKLPQRVPPKFHGRWVPADAFK